MHYSFIDPKDHSTHSFSLPTETNIKDIDVAFICTTPPQPSWTHWNNSLNFILLKNISLKYKDIVLVESSGVFLALVQELKCGVGKNDYK